MKGWILLCFTCMSYLAGQAQWQGSSSVQYFNGGNVGIGTGSPQELFHVFSSALYPRAIVQSTNASGAPGFAIADNTGTEKWTWHYSIPQAFTGFFLAGVGNVMVLTNDGNVAIGTTDPKGYKLAVNGSAIFTSAVVKLNANWPDYVFKKEYALPTLESVSAYIRAYQHLPGIPCADSVQSKGVDIGGTQAALLKKIEELTLYAIDQDKAINNLKESQQQLQKQNESLSKQNNLLSKRLDQLDKKLSAK